MKSAMKVSIACVICVLLFEVVDAALIEYASNRASSTAAAEGGQKNVGSNSKNDLKTILNVNSHYDFIVVRSETTVQGTTKQRVQVTYDGLPVLGISIQATHDSKKGYTGDMTGKIVSGIENDIPDSSDCQRNKATLFSLGKEQFGMPADCQFCRLVEANRSVSFDDVNKAHLVYTIGIVDMTPNKFSRPYLIVDACSLSTYMKFDRKNTIKRSNPKSKRNMQSVSNKYKRQPCPNPATGTGGNLKTGDINYGTPPFCLDLTNIGRGCLLANNDVNVVDLNHAWVANGPTYQYDCIAANDAFNGANSPDLDAFFFGTVMTQVFRTEYNINQPLGRQMEIFTHYGVNYENAEWDGIALIFGDGFNIFYPLVSLDIVAHEVAHGITEANSNLVYMNEPGGINEAFSDITGEAVEFMAAYRDNDWLVGSEIIKAAGDALRYFQDPTRDGNSIAHVRDYVVGMDVHFSSGIYNKVFYEMVVTQAIPMKDAYNCFLKANQIYWNLNTDFAQGACDVQSAAVDLGVDVVLIQAAFAVVGINSNACGAPGLETIQPGTIIIAVSDVVNPCYLLLPKTDSWYYIYMTTANPNRQSITITLKDPVTNQVIGTKRNRFSFYLPGAGQQRSVCFSSAAATTVTVDTHYCGEKLCYH